MKPIFEHVKMKTRPVISGRILVCGQAGIKNLLKHLDYFAYKFGPSDRSGFAGAKDPNSSDSIAKLFSVFWSCWGKRQNTA